MRVSGYTFIRNGGLLAYPFVESIRSILPIVDEFVVVVGDSEDDTMERIRAIGDPKIKVVETRWNEGLHTKGYVYAQQKMIGQFSCTGDWAFYLEGDEVLHERNLPTVRASMERHLDDPRIEALVFDYLHFWGVPGQLIQGPGSYRRAPRIIRNTIRSFTSDALYFLVLHAKKRGRYPRAALARAPIYHYGHVRPAASAAEKDQRIRKYWSRADDHFHGYGAVDPERLAPFTGTHPAVMTEWLAAVAPKEFALDPDYRLNFRDRRHRIARPLERWFGFDFTRRHFKLLAR